MNSKPPIVTGILSYGMSGEVFHAPLLSAHPGFRVKRILQRNSETARQHYPEVQVVKRVDDLVRDEEIELVIVNTPNETHVEFTTLFLEAGKHVVVEKPFTPKANESQKLIALAAKKKRMLSVFQSRRWDGSFMTLKKVIDSGVLGKIVEFEAHYDRFRNFIAPNTWKEEPGPGSGILYNLGSHLLDQVLVLFGRPQSVSAMIGIQRPGGKVDDYYDLRLRYDGLNAIVKSSYLVREPGPFYVVHGTNGSFVKYGLDPQEDALKLRQIPGSPGWGQEPEKWWGTLNTEIDGLHYTGKIETLAGDYPGFYRNIYDVIREGKELAVKPEQAMNVIEVIEAATRSSVEQKTIPLTKP